MFNTCYLLKLQYYIFSITIIYCMLPTSRTTIRSMFNIVILTTILSLTVCLNDKKCDFGSKDCQENIEKGIDLYDNSNQSQLDESNLNKVVIQADTFYLIAEIKNQSVEIILKDYLSWVIYKKVYMEKDVGKEINKKVDLTDIFSAFVGSDNPSSSTIKKRKVLIKYKFGDKFDFGKGSSWFKIEKGGLLTVYTKTWTRTNEAVVQSVLKLEKIKSMNDVEIFSTKSQIQKRQLFELLSLEIDGLKKENLLLKKEVVYRNQFSSDLKNPGLTVINQQILKPSGETPDLIGLVIPSFSKIRLNFMSKFVMKQITIVGVGICSKSLVSQAQFTSKQGAFLIKNNGNIVSNYKPQIYQQQKSFTFEKGNIIEVKVDTQKHIVSFRKESQKYQMQYNPELQNSDLHFCVSMENSSNEVSVSGFSFVSDEI